MATADKARDDGQIATIAYMNGFEEGKRAALAKVAKKATSLAQQTAPERIYLDIGEEAAMHEAFSDREVTWSEDNATDHGIEYVRADLAQAVPAGWRPIESAPKECVLRDGNHTYGPIVLLHPGRRGEVVRGRWWQHKDGSSNFIADGGVAVFPTSWQPLPASPQAPSGGESEHG